jgi:hypothetical protein
MVSSWCDGYTKCWCGRVGGSSVPLAVCPWLPPNKHTLRASVGWSLTAAALISMTFFSRFVAPPSAPAEQSCSSSNNAYTSMGCHQVRPLSGCCTSFVHTHTHPLAFARHDQ